MKVAKILQKLIAFEGTVMLESDKIDATCMVLIVPIIQKALQPKHTERTVLTTNRTIMHAESMLPNLSYQVAVFCF